MKGIGEHGRGAAKGLVVEECVAVDINGDRLRIPALAEGTDADDGAGGLLLIEGVGERPGEAARLGEAAEGRAGG